MVAGQWRHWPLKCMLLERERASLALREMETHQVAALDSKRADKDAGGSLAMDLDFSLFGNKGISVFCRKEWLGAGKILALPNWAPF